MEVLAELRRQQRTAYGQVEKKSVSEECRVIWRQMSGSGSEPYFRLFFEVYGIALRRPDTYRDFLHHTMEDWLRLLSDGFVRDGYKRAEARALATVILAGLRGFMLDFCTTHDRRRVDRAVRLWLSGLDAMLSGARKDG